jgi:hypothetical protein
MGEPQSFRVALPNAIRLYRGSARTALGGDVSEVGTRWNYAVPEPCSLATHSGAVRDNDEGPDSVGLSPALCAWHLRWSET